MSEVERDPKQCVECHEWLSGTAMEHGDEGFGHQGRCCECYDRAMGVPEEKLRQRYQKKGRSQQ